MSEKEEKKIEAAAASIRTINDVATGLLDARSEQAKVVVQFAVHYGKLLPIAMLLIAGVSWLYTTTVQLYPPLPFVLTEAVGLLVYWKSLHYLQGLRWRSVDFERSHEQSKADQGNYTKGSAATFCVLFLLTACLLAFDLTDPYRMLLGIAVVGGWILLGLELHFFLAMLLGIAVSNRRSSETIDRFVHDSLNGVNNTLKSLVEIAGDLNSRVNSMSLKESPDADESGEEDSQASDQ